MKKITNNYINRIFLELWFIELWGRVLMVGLMRPKLVILLVIVIAAVPLMYLCQD